MRLISFVMAAALLANAQTPFDTLVDQFFRDYYHFSPTEGTAQGFHEYDRSLDDYSPASLDRFRAAMNRYLAEFRKQPPGFDRDLVLNKIQSQLLSLDEIRFWETNPDLYSSLATVSVFSLISRKFAPPEERLESVIAREKLIVGLLETARHNLKNPPRIYTEVAIEQLPGMQSFFRDDVPKAFSLIRQHDLLERFHNANAAVLDALQSYLSFLKSDVLPRSHGDFRIGAEKYRKKLLYEEDVDIPLDRILAIGYANLRENQKQLASIAREIDPHKTPEQIVVDLGRDHPAPDKLLAAFQDTFADLQRFIRDKHIITIPSTIEPILEETPPFMRALTTASMDTPGPYETHATEAYFNVTLPEKNWPPEEVQEYMTAFTRGTLVSTSIHEAYPGHYVQLLWFKQVPSKVRKRTQSNSNVEGWAHYSEQMMMEQDYLGSDPKIHFGQLMDALLRNCRYIVGIEMHTGRMTYESAVEFFMKEGYMTRAYSERETKRGTSDPTYLVYTLGKLQILKLREDYKRKTGSTFSLEQFHTEFVRQGGIPVTMIRRIMLGDDSPSL